MARLKTATRTIHNAGGGRVIGLIPSRKNRFAVAWESAIERDFYYLCEYSKQVTRYVHQPEQIRIWCDGRVTRYTPDTHVYLDDDTDPFFDVKPDDWAKNPKLVRRLEVAEIHYRRQGNGFHVIEASKIRRGHLIDNIKLLYYYADWRATTIQETTVLDCLPDLGETIYLGELREKARSMGLCLGLIYRFMFEELIGADLEFMPIGPDMLVWRNNK